MSLNVINLLLQELESQAATYKSKEIQKLLAEVKSELQKLENPDTAQSSSPAPVSQTGSGAEEPLAEVQMINTSKK